MPGYCVAGTVGAKVLNKVQGDGFYFSLFYFILFYFILFLE